MFFKTLTTGSWTRSGYVSWSMLGSLLDSMVRTWTSHVASLFPTMDNMVCMSLKVPQALMLYIFPKPKDSHSASGSQEVW